MKESLKETISMNSLSVYRPPFKKKEYSNRFVKLIEIMDKENLDVLVLLSPDLLYYFTGFTGWSFYVPQFLLIYKKNLYLILRGMDSAAASSTTYLNQTQILFYPDYYVDNIELHPIQLLDKFIKKDNKLGLELNGHYCKGIYYLEFRKLTKNIVDISLLTNKVRLIKSKQELNFIRKAAKIVDLSMLKAINYIREGRSTAQICGKIINSQLSKGGIYTGLAPMVSVDENAAHMNWTNTKLKRGQLVKIEMGAAYLHYHCPLSRTIFVGNKEELKNSIYKDIYQVESSIQKAILKLLDIIRPGIESRELAIVFNNILEDSNLNKQSRIGYSFGIGFPPDWGENTLSVRKEDSMIIEENMCIHLILGAGDAWGYQYSEAIIVTQNGPELLCKTPRIIFLSDNKYNGDILENYDTYIPALRKYSKLKN